MTPSTLTSRRSPPLAMVTYSLSGCTDAIFLLVPPCPRTLAGHTSPREGISAALTSSLRRLGLVERFSLLTTHLNGCLLYTSPSPRDSTSS
eukprot:12297621-Prorocentrum_lima.AAC.1